MANEKRRKSGEGSVRKYQTASGQDRWLIVYRVKDPATGKTKQVLRRVGSDGRPFTTERAAIKALRAALVKIDTNTYAEPSKQPFGEYLDEWLDGLQLAPSTIASYRKNVRLHVKPYLGGTPLCAVTATMLSAHYRVLEQKGRADGSGGLSKRTVRYVHTIVSAALRAAVREGRLITNQATLANPPSARQAKSPEMHPWDSTQLRAFLDWSKDRDDDLFAAWRLLGYTGMRRGEALALQWRDIDFDKAELIVRRSATLIRTKGKGEEIVVGPPKSGKDRRVTLDPETVAVLRAYKRHRGEISLSFARADSYVFGRTVDGEIRHPERFSRTFRTRVAQARRALGEDALPDAHVHDLRHSHATILLGELKLPVKVVSERLGHSSPMITLTVYQWVLPTMQREAADSFAALLGAQ